MELILSSMMRIKPEGDKNVRIRDFLTAEINKDYQDNPVVAALLDGELKSLDYVLLYDSEIEPVHLFSHQGKRVYRHSLCFLLAYAAWKLYPERHLIIRHSLGDGYYFTFTDGPVTKAETDRLRKLMEQIVADDLPIGKTKLAYRQAEAYYKEAGFTQCSSLLETHNDSIITLFTLDGFLDTVYEALVPRTGLLRLWELRKYSEGLLLRYPQSDSLLEIKPFTDNPLLFRTLDDNGKDCDLLNVRSIGDLNTVIKAKKSRELIEMAEALYNRRIGIIASNIKKRGDVKVVFIAGPSSSGKTTSSLKLCAQLSILGYKPVKISLDDYYHPIEKIPLDEDGKTDFEAFEALNIPLFQQQITDLIKGAEVHLLKYDFKTRSRRAEEKATQLDKNSIIVVEGIHGLNPRLLPSLAKEHSFRIYISALTTVNIDDHNRISTTDNRIIRRIVRDSRTRGVSASETLSMWPQVERGEKMHIFPYQNEADVMINSAMCYELATLAGEGCNQLRSVKPEDGDAYTTARRLLKFLSLFYSLDDADIPKDSVIREFIGGSVYGAI